MFRNGIVAGRRQLAAGRSLNNGIAAPRKGNLLPFVCCNCQARRDAATWRGKSNVKNDKPEKKQNNMLSQIKRLEAHVQHMERAYNDHLKKRAATESLPDVELTEEDKDKAYASLMAPADMRFLPAPRKLTTLLSEPMKRRMVGGVELINQRAPWEQVLDQLELNGGLEGLDTQDAHTLLIVMSMEGRASVGHRLLAMMEEAGVEKTTFTYDLVIHGHAALENSTAIRELFAEMAEKNISPSKYTYGNLMKAFAIDHDVAAAAAAFQEMHACGIEPNLIIYTGLIKTCINAKDYDMASQIFNLIKLKSTSTAPDVDAYNTMITGCAQNGETERALDLWADMTVRRELVPDEASYRAIIHACAVNKQYFNEAWKYALDMKNAGYILNAQTQNELIQACGKNGELTRARLLVRHMVGSGRADMLPDKFTYQNLLRAYSNFRPRKSTDKFSFTKDSDGLNKTDKAAFVQNDARIERREDNDFEDDLVRIPFFEKSVLENNREVLDEAALIINWLRDVSPELVDTQMLNSYLDICINHLGFEDFKWSYKYDLMNPTNTTLGEVTILPPKTADEELANLPALPRNLYTFRIALQAASQFRNLKFARQVMADREAYIKSEPHANQLAGINDEERYNLDIQAQLAMIDVLAISDLLGEARDRMEMVAKTGYQWKWTQLRTLYIKAIQLEDPEIIMAVKRITGKANPQDTRYTSVART